MRIIFATGGTGGHLYPAIALAKYIENKYDNVEFLFVGTTNRLEAEVVPKLGYNYRGVHVLGLAGNPLEKAKALAVFALSLTKTRKIVKEFKPDIVIGFGGYVSASIVLAASILGVKTVIHEQNSIIGLANKILINKVDKIICCYELAYNNFPKEKTLLLGNPRATEIATQVVNENVLKKYNLDNNKKTILVVMGSLGSSSVNKILRESINEIETKEYQMIFVTGKNGYQDMISSLDTIPNNVKVVPYIDDMPSVIKACDIVVSRSGASTIAELTAIGAAMILIPSPYVASNHQEYNAMELVDKDAAMIIKEVDLTSSKLVNMIDELLSNNEKIESLKSNALKLGKIDACEKITEVIVELIRK